MPGPHVPWLGYTVPHSVAFKQKPLIASQFAAVSIRSVLTAHPREIK